MLSHTKSSYGSVHAGTKKHNKTSSRLGAIVGAALILVVSCFGVAALASAGGVPRETIILDRVDAAASTTAPLSIIACDPATVDLSDFEVWRREEGYWWGNYTFLGADGDPYTSPAWPYEYQPYWGFIHLELVGNSLKQRNVFVYPPRKDCSADDSVVGAGTCGVNGNERVFKADQNASDCDGNLAGPYETPFGTVDTTTTVLGNDSVVYRVTLPAAFGGGLNQNQLTTLPGNGVRVRTAQGFTFGDEQPDFASFYREYKLGSRDEWLAKLAQIRAANNILESDECVWVAGEPPESGVTCEEHFGFPV
mmetsp:Transcript_33396/g.103471  ORF Transcript_33396/g.103471 Transcript_33396/m.103471 type:complete len:308 (+) Transcript_33396:80-1003(+)